MCRTVNSLVSAVLCSIQMVVRVFMTFVLLLENLCRMILQTLYNFVSFMLQLISLIPICCVFLLTSRLKCFMCGGGGPCPVNRGGACDCLMSIMAVIILFAIFRATGVLDKIFYGIGYVKATPKITRFLPTPGDLTECSRNDTDTEYVFYKIEESTIQVYEYEATETEIYYDDDVHATTVTRRTTGTLITEMEPPDDAEGPPDIPEAPDGPPPEDSGATGQTGDDKPDVPMMTNKPTETDAGVTAG